MRSLHTNPGTSRAIINALQQATSLTTDALTYLPANDTIDFRLIDRLVMLLKPWVRYFRTTITGLEHLPKDKGCLCISNHAVWGIDAVILYAALFIKTHRVMRGLAEPGFFRTPAMANLVLRLGMVEGSRDNAVRLLTTGKWVMCYPAGLTESFKPNSQKYRLMWNERLAYLRMAIAASVPIVPVASVGIDEAFFTIGHEPLIGRRLFGNKKFDLPILAGLGPLPLPVKFTFAFHEPIDLKKQFGLTQRHADVPASQLVPVHKAIWEHTQDLIDAAIKKRKNRFF